MRGRAQADHRLAGFDVIDDVFHLFIRQVAEAGLDDQGCRISQAELLHGRRNAFAAGSELDGLQMWKPSTQTRVIAIPGKTPGPDAATP